MIYPPERQDSPAFAIQYAKWLFVSGAAAEVGPDATALLMAVVTLEDEFRYQRAPNFFNAQLMARCGIASEHALNRARQRAIDAGLLVYIPAKKRSPGRYFVDGFPEFSLRKTQGKRGESEEKVRGKRGESEEKARPSNPSPSPNPSPNKSDGEPSPGSKVKYSEEDYELSTYMLTKLRELNEGHKDGTKTWANDIRLMRERDKRTHAQIRELFTKANSDKFWQGNILSAAALRKHWDRLEIQFKGKRANSGAGVTFSGGVRNDSIGKF